MQKGDRIDVFRQLDTVTVQICIAVRQLLSITISAASDV